MKYLKQLTVIAFLITGFTAKAQFKLDHWPELKTFHGVMSQTFHPSEEGNLEPIKTRVTEMYTKALALSKSTVPASLKNQKAIKEAVAQLVSGSKELEALIKAKATDDTIKTKLSGLHDTFHKIIEKCSKEDEAH